MAHSGNNDFFIITSFFLNFDSCYDGTKKDSILRRRVRILLSLRLDPVQLAFPLAQFKLHVADSPLVTHHNHLQVL